jgi:hypothetical protein
MTDFDAWVIYAESAGAAPRSTDDPLFPWAWDEVIAVLPPTATPGERAAALMAVLQTSHYQDGDRSDLLDFRDPDHHFWTLARQDYLDPLHPYLVIARARNLGYVPSDSGEGRGRITFDLVPEGE